MLIRKPKVTVEVIHPITSIMSFTVSKHALANEYVIILAEKLDYSEGKVIVSRNPVMYDYSAHPAIWDLVQLSIFEKLLELGNGEFKHPEEMK